MKRRYRLVVDESTCSAFVLTNEKGYRGRIGLSAATALAAAAEFPIAEKDFPSRLSPFLKRARELEWLNDDGNFPGDVTIVPTGPHLKRLQIELTLTCNLACAYCYSSSGRNRKESLTLRQVLSVVDDAEKLGCLSIDFTGGEFFLYPHWKNVIDYTYYKVIPLSIHTNGTALNRENIDYIAQKGLTHIQVSLDSEDPETHDLVRGRRGAHAKAVSGIRYARSIGIPVNISVVLHKRNVHTAPNIVNWIVRNLKCKVLLDRVIPAGREVEANDSLSPKEFYEAVAPLLSRNVDQTRVCAGPTSERGAVVEPECGVAHSFVYLTATGEVALCPTMTSRDSDLFSSPNLNSTSLYDAWLSSAYFKSYRYLNCENISRCPAASRCGGGCRSNAYLDGGRLDSPDVVSCNIMKNSGETFIDFIDQYERNTKRV